MRGALNVIREMAERTEHHLLKLAAVAGKLDPMPIEAAKAAVACFAWRSIGAELADLVFDSASRPNQTGRQLIFEAPDLIIELVVDQSTQCPLIGYLWPECAAEIEIRSCDGTLTVSADESGRFCACELRGRVVSLRIRRPGHEIEWVTTPWFTIVPLSGTPLSGTPLSGTPFLATEHGSLRRQEALDMAIAVIGTGFIGGILGRALAGAGYCVTFGSRHPDDDDVADDTPAVVASIGEALAAADIVILALPGPAVPNLATGHGEALAGKLVIDATNQMGQPVANSRASLPDSVRYARVFNTLGGENVENALFADGPADMFFSGPEGDRSTTEAIIRAVGLRPIYVGEDQEALIDALFQIWIALAIKQGRGRRLALRLLEG